MTENPSDSALLAARGGDAAQFDRLVGPYRRELRAFCYRLTGSLSDADDVVQESLVRAWNGLAGFEGRSSVRTWLYRIATHASLSAMERRQRRFLPSDLSAPGAGAAPRGEPLWLEPCAEDAWVDLPLGPEAQLSARQSVAVAFLAALQVLPAQQRAVLVLREVLGWSAAEVAELLDTSVAAVNSALQRARATLESRRGALESAAPLDPADSRTRELLQRYIGAWEGGDAQALTALLRDDAVLTMPPLAAWYQGREAVVAFLEGIFRDMGPFRGRPVLVCGGPGVAIAMRGPDGEFHPQSVHALAGLGGGLAHVDVFMDPRTLAPFAAR